MSANSHDALVAGLIFGAVLVLLGQGVIWFVRSEWSERLVAQEAAAAPFAHSLDAGSADYEAHVAHALAMTEEACVVPLPGRRLAAVPEQRKGDVS